MQGAVFTIDTDSTTSTAPDGARTRPAGVSPRAICTPICKRPGRLAKAPLRLPRRPPGDARLARVAAGLWCQVRLSIGTFPPRPFPSWRRGGPAVGNIGIGAAVGEMARNPGPSARFGCPPAAAPAVGRMVCLYPGIACSRPYRPVERLQRATNLTIQHCLTIGPDNGEYLREYPTPVWGV